MNTLLFEQILDIPEKKIGEWEVKHKIVPKGNKLTIVSLRDAIFSGKKQQSAILDFPLRLHFLHENGNTWMSDTPQEVEGQKEVVEKCKGHVLIGGLGLGWIAKMLDRKPDVKSIVVVEKEKAVIDLVWKHLKLEKSTIVHDDLFEYLKKTNNKFSWAYYDIWAPTGEDVLYTHIRPLKTLSKGKVAMNRILCWAEETMLGQMRMNLFTTVQTMEDEKFGILSLSDEVFHHHYRFSRTTWAFKNWVRQVKPNKEKASEMAEHYCSTYTDYEQWSYVWGAWEKRSNDE